MARPAGADRFSATVTVPHVMRGLGGDPGQGFAENTGAAGAIGPSASAATVTSINARGAARPARSRERETTRSDPRSSWAPDHEVGDDEDDNERQEREPCHAHQPR